MDVKQLPSIKRVRIVTLALCKWLRHLAIGLHSLLCPHIN